MTTNIFVSFLTLSVACAYPAPAPMTLSASPIDTYSLTDIEAYVVVLDEELASEGLIPHKGELLDTIGDVSITWINAYSFQCGNTSNAAGCYDWDSISVTVETCLGETALGHELVHQYLHHRGVDSGDGDHALPIWNTLALRSLLLKFCSDKYNDQDLTIYRGI